MVREQVEKKGFLLHLGGGVVITGGGSLMHGCAELAKEIFGVPARIGFPRPLGGLSPEYANPMYATAVGLVMYGEASLAASGNDGGSFRMKGDGFLEKLRGWMKEFF